MKIILSLRSYRTLILVCLLSFILILSTLTYGLRRETVSIKQLSIDDINMQEFYNITDTDPEHAGKLGKQLRFFNDLYKRNPNSENLKIISQTLFPWFKHKKDLHSYQKSFSGQGLILCVGGNVKTTVPMTLAALRMIRTSFKSSLPIEIFYNGDSDLSKESRQRLQKIGNIKILNLEDLFYTMPVQGYNMKPFAMLASSFEHAIMMDADAFFLRDPSELFLSKSYLSHGTAFFHDRIFNYWNAYTSSKQQNYIKNVLGGSFNGFENVKMVTGETNQEQDSAVVALDRKSHFLGILASCALISLTDKSVFHGDKEFFWLGLASIGSSFSFHGHYNTGAPGSLVDSEICDGHMLHFTDDLKPFFINSGITKDKFNEAEKPLVWDEWLDQTLPATRWEGFFCLKTFSSSVKAAKFTPEEKELMRKTGEFYLEELSIN